MQKKNDSAIKKDDLVKNRHTGESQYPVFS